MDRKLQLSPFMPPLSRRRFLQTASVAAAAAWSRPRIFGADAATPTAADLIPGKDRRLIVHVPSKKGFEIETPLELLTDDKLTPVERLFVRNNTQPDWSATLEPPTQPNWKIEISGLLEYPRIVTLDELRELPQVEHELVLQCSGNGRAMFAEATPIKGAQWRYGAMGNVRFKGVPLKAVFEKFEVRPHATARYLTAAGADTPSSSTAADFEHSMLLQDTLARSILALELNGKPLPAVHGGPLRLVTPGFYGTMNVKWLTGLRLDAQETVNHHQVKRYRTPRDPLEVGAPFDYGLENSDPNWRMRIKSVIFAPFAAANLKSGNVLASGVAWNDGTSRIDAVELSLDKGRTWRKAELEAGAGRYAWQRWQLPLQLERGKYTLISRAFDTLGNTQPLDGMIDWNPAGYCWHGADRVTFQIV